MSENSNAIAEAIAEAIVESERPRLDKVMRYVAEHIQQDFVNETAFLLDAYYSDYMDRPPRQYIRTDELDRVFTKNGGVRIRGKNGKFAKKTTKTGKLTNAAKREKDISLWDAFYTFGYLALGVCEPLEDLKDNDVIGYEAGIRIDDEVLSQHMKHSVMGPKFKEQYIVENFMEGEHGGGSENKYTTSPSASEYLTGYLDKYDSRFDKHYQDALRIYKNTIYV